MRVSECDYEDSVYKDQMLYWLRQRLSIQQRL